MLKKLSPIERTTSIGPGTSAEIVLAATNDHTGTISAMPAVPRATFVMVANTAVRSIPALSFRVVHPLPAPRASSAGDLAQAGDY